MTDEARQKLRDQTRVNTLTTQRNNAQNEVVECYAHIAVLDAEIAELRAEVAELKAPKPKVVKPKP